MRFAIILAAGFALSTSTLAAPPLQAANDEQPTVVANSCRPPVYPTMMRAAQMEGRVLLEFAVDSVGRVDATTINTISSSHSQFEEAARRAVVTCRYRPAIVNQQPARAVVRMPYTFTFRTAPTGR